MKEASKEPSYRLELIKQAFNKVTKLNMTVSATQSQYELGFSDREVVDVIQALTNNDFCKSMPPVNKYFTAWQDVYKPIFKKTPLYIKFQIDKRGEVIVSFKVR